MASTLIYTRSQTQKSNSFAQIRGMIVCHGITVL
jgi:hypothetical protein